MQKLKNVDDLVLILGGTAEAAKALHVAMPNISNWKAHNRIPANQYLAVNAVLEGLNCKAGMELFAFKKRRRK